MNAMLGGHGGRPRTLTKQSSHAGGIGVGMAMPGMVKFVASPAAAAPKSVKVESGETPEALTHVTASRAVMKKKRRPKSRGSSAKAKAGEGFEELVKEVKEEASPKKSPNGNAGFWGR